MTKRAEAYFEIQEILLEAMYRVDYCDMPFICVASNDYQGMWHDSPPGVSPWENTKTYWVKATGAAPTPTPTPSPTPTPTPTPPEVTKEDMQKMADNIADLAWETDTLSSQIESLKNQIDAIPAPTSNNMSYVAIALAIVSFCAALYFGTKK